MSHQTTYQYGFGNEHSSEVRPNTLPLLQNSPRQVKNGLYAEQINGTAFTMERKNNLRTWFYRMLPTAAHSATAKEEPVLYRGNPLFVSPISSERQSPSAMRWKPFSKSESLSFVDSLTLISTAGNTTEGLSIYQYHFCLPMFTNKKALQSSDGDILLIPHSGNLLIKTELGLLHCNVGEIVLIPRGFRFSIDSSSSSSKGYALHLMGGHFELPELGVIGANGLANPRHFAYPTLPKEESDIDDSDWTIFNIFNGRIWTQTETISPFDVMAWHGNYSPFKYDLHSFMPIGPLLWDHCDPSIFTVLTCKSSRNGWPLCDFVIFPPRWQVSENTFRPPYFHRNCMSEFMGLITGVYEAKDGDGFQPGGASLHHPLTSHGPDRQCYDKAIISSDVPERSPDGMMSFMIETSLTLLQSDWALDNKEDGYARTAWASFNK